MPDAQDSAAINPGTGPRRDLARWIFLAIAVLLLPAMILASSHFGVTWDEKARHRNGELTWDFLSGARSLASFPEGEFQLYGGVFDVICVAAERWLPGNRYVLRHAVTAVFGWVGIVYCGRLAARLFGSWAGVLAMVLLVGSPRYFADSMNNPKDLPFAALMIVVLYYLSTISPKWPYVSTTTALKIVVPMALALNIRAGALMYAGYFGILLACFVIAERNTSWRRLADTALRVAIVLAAILVLGTTFWPWAREAPFTRPIQALVGFAAFPYDGLVLFKGREMGAMHLPWYYAPWWLLISTPPAVLAGAVLSAGPPRDGRVVVRSALWSVALLPVVLVIVQRSTLYDGIRHLLFIYPVIVVMAACGWAEWISPARRMWVRIAAGALLAVGLADMLVFNVRAFPNQTVYFNQLVGGPRGAFARYDMDYWGNCVLEAVTWSAGAAKRSGRPITVSGNPWHLVELNAQRFPQLLFTPPHRNQHDLTIRLNRGPIAGVTELASRPGALYQVKTPDGAVLCVVLPGPAFERLRPRFVAPAP